MSNVSGEQLRLLIERVERLEEEKKGISDDIKDVYAEAKAVGYRITDNGDTLILEPYRAHFTGFIITADILNEFSLK